MEEILKELSNFELEQELQRVPSLMDKKEENCIDEERKLELLKSKFERIKTKVYLELLTKTSINIEKKKIVKKTAKMLELEAENNDEVFKIKIAVINQTIVYKKKKHEFNSLERRFVSLRKVANLRGAQINKGIWEGIKRNPRRKVSEDYPTDQM